MSSFSGNQHTGINEPRASEPPLHSTGFYSNPRAAASQHGHKTLAAWRLTLSPTQTRAELPVKSGTTRATLNITLTIVK